MKKGKIILVMGILAVLLAGCASNAKTDVVKTDADGRNLSTKDLSPRVMVSKHVEIPDSSSKILTEPMEFDGSASSIEITRLMGNGINLGNTMEAYRSSAAMVNRDATYYEQLWGQPVTTQKMIQGYVEAGFDTLRIPVAWTNAMAYDSGDYVINSSYLDRVETIVGWALDEGMYVIINDHWDGAWWGMFGSWTEEIRESAKELYKAMWIQIANRFKNYDEYLIFEGGNEETGDSLNDTRSCWNSGYLSREELYTTANMINQIFVDTVRSTGGNNSERYLLIPGYNTDVRKTVDSRWQLPKDSAQDKLIVSVHYYDPSPLCIGKGDDWGSKGDIGDMDTTLKLLTRFTVDESVGVVIGEYGVLPNPDFKTATNFYHSLFLDECDYYGFCPVLWDTGTACYYDKSKAKLINEDFAKLYLSHAFTFEDSVDPSIVKESAHQRFAKAYKDAPTSLTGNSLEGRKDIAIAYLMYADSSWGVNYSVGDEYKPSSKSKDLTATDTAIEKPGEYSVKLDFSTMKANGMGKANGVSFSALGIANGEALHPDWIIQIRSIKVNDKEIPLTKKNYTTSDGNNTTRANLYNEWVTNIPTGVRTVDGSTEGCGACIFDKGAVVFSAMKTYEVSFYYGPADGAL